MMPKGIPNKRYTPEFKKQVIETMRQEKLSYGETARRFKINSHGTIEKWERIYLTEGPEGFAVDDAVGVALITGTRVTVLLRVEPSLRLRRLLRQRRKLPVFLLLQSFPNGHD